MTQIRKLPLDARDPQTYAIIGAAMEVHRVLGPGFLEAVYREALAVELSGRKIPYVREGPVPVLYKGLPLGIYYRPDFMCFEDVVLEIKAQSGLGNVEEAQVINYLKVSERSRALLFNFGGGSLQYRRFIHTVQSSPRSTVTGC